jgi:hypothetical protein
MGKQIIQCAACPQEKLSVEHKWRKIPNAQFSKRFIMENIIEWFDIKNINHIKAYEYLEKTGIWPKDFLPENLEFCTNWNLILMSKMTTEYVKNFIANKEIK